MDYTIEDLIPKALLNKLEQEGKSLVHTPEGWITVETTAIQLSTTLPLVLRKLEGIEMLLQEYILDNELDIEVKNSGESRTLMDARGAVGGDQESNGSQTA